MKIFLMTDNLWWFEKAFSYFSCSKHEVSFFCSPSSETIFSNELSSGLLVSLSLKDNLEFLCSFDLGISAHCKQIFPAKLVEDVRCINLHPGLNPFNRGWYPQVFSILNKKPAGATMHYMDEEIDHGHIIAQEQVKILSSDTSLSVYRRILDLEYRLFEDNINNVIDETDAAWSPENSVGNYNSIQDFNDLKLIDLQRKTTFGDAIDFLRAMTHPPYRNAYFIDDEGNKIFVSVKLECDRD